MSTETQPPVLRPEHAREFRKRVRALNSLLRSVRKYCPGANYYLACDTLHLMVGPPHTDDPHTTRQTAHHENVGESCILLGGDGGDW